MAARRLPSFGVQIMAAMALGLALGLAARAIGGDANWLTVTLSTVGSLFIQLLKAIVPPLVFTAIVASIANLAALESAGRLVTRTLLWFALTAAIAVAIGLTIGLLIAPGRHAGIPSAAAHLPDTMGGWTDFLRNIVPANFLGIEASTRIGEDGRPVSAIGFNVLQIVVLSIAVGIAALRSGDKGIAFLGVVQSASAIVRKVLGWLIRLTPIATIGLFGTAVAQYGWSTLAQLGWFAGCVYLGLGLVLLVVYPALLRLNGISPARFFAAVWPATQLGFVSRSSIGTLPVTEQVTIEGLRVPRSYAAFAIPLAATTKMDGCAAVYPAVASLFIAQFYGLPFGPGDCALVFLVSVLGSAATAGVTGAIVMLTLTLSTLGLPLEGVGLLLAIDPILDMGRTAVNVTGQALVALIVARREGLLAADAPILIRSDTGIAALPVR